MSKIAVNTIDSQCGSALQIGCTNTATIGLGKSGDTITIPCGATIVNSGTQTGFGRTGTVDWKTDSIKTATFTATSGEGYFANTTGGVFNMNLPAGAAGSIVSVKDYLNTFDTNALTVVPNGTDKIGGTNANYTISTESLSLTLVYVDSTRGWVDIHESTQAVEGASFVVATGGTPCSGAIACTDYKVHTFTGPGTFTVTSAGNPAGSTTVDYLVVAGGAGGAGATDNGSGGGGAGGLRASQSTYSGPPSAIACGVAVSASPGAYAVVVGGGGGGGPTSPPRDGSAGSTSSAFCISSAGGGGGGMYNTVGVNGGSGGGSGENNQNTSSGNTPPTTPSQGNDGGGAVPGGPRGTGGGGGAGAVGVTGTGNCSGAGGVGQPFTITGSDVDYAGGGGGGVYCGTTGAASPCGTGGAGKPIPAGSQPACGPGTTNRGGGGGGSGGQGGGTSVVGALGGSGVVIIRYKFQ